MPVLEDKKYSLLESIKRTLDRIAEWLKTDASNRVEDISLITFFKGQLDKVLLELISAQHLNDILTSLQTAFNNRSNPEIFGNNISNALIKIPNFSKETIKITLQEIANTASKKINKDSTTFETMLKKLEDNITALEHKNSGFLKDIEIKITATKVSYDDNVKQLNTLKTTKENELNELKKKKEEELTILKKEKETEFDTLQKLKSSEWDDTKTSLVNRHEEVIEELESFMPMASAVGLASDYYHAKQEYGLKFNSVKDRKNPSEKTKEEFAWCRTLLSYLIPYSIFVLSIVSLMIFYAWVFLKNGDMSLYKYLPLSLPLIWLAWFGQHTISMKRRMYEEYNHKEKVMRMYMGLKKDESIAPENKKEMETKLMTIVLKTIEENPSRILGVDNSILDRILHILVKSK